MYRIVTTLATLVLVSAALTVPAFAHAKFVSSTPAPGQTVASSPASVTITFTEELGSGTTGSVTDVSGAVVSTGTKISDDHLQLAIALKPALPNGVYKVIWHSVAEDDGGIVDGSFFFGVGVPAPSTATLPSADLTALALGLLVLAGVIGLFSARALRAGRA